MTNALEHIGVLGMKWGKRKQNSKITSVKKKTIISKPPSTKTKARINDLINKKKAKKVNEIKESDLEKTQRALAGTAYAATMQSILMYNMTHNV